MKKLRRFAHLVGLASGLLLGLSSVSTSAAPLKVTGRFLQDAHGNNLMLRGVDLPVYKSGYADDLDAVAAAIALTKTNAVRLEWWAVPPAGTTEYTVANFDRAIQKFYDLGIIPIVELHDLTFVYGHDDEVGPNSDGNDPVIFANTITAFWTRPDIVAILVKHQDHLVINLANEWGSSFYSDATPTTANFIANYTDAIFAMRTAGIVAPLMIDAPKGFEYQFLLDQGAALLALDPQHNTMLSAHAYWAASDPAFTVAAVNVILDNFMNSHLPIVLGEASSNAYTAIPCDPIDYVNLLTRANTNAIGYLFWAWYEDGQCNPDVNPLGQSMNITVGADGITRPTIANPGYGYDALYHAAFGIDAALPATTKADFSPVGLALLNTSFNYNVTSTNDNATRATTALVTRLNNFGVEKRPVVVLMPGWGGTGDVAAARDAQTLMFANQGYVALNIGFHQTSDVPAGAPAQWYGDLAESAKAALDVLCAEAYADCAAVVLTGESYGGTQTHPVVRYMRASGTFDGSGGANGGRKVLGILGQDSGYSYYWNAPQDADATAYSVAMIENMGDADFPVDSCAFGNCGARNRADYHRTAPGSAFVLSYCPAGGSHGSRGYADWDAWVLSAVKTMLHTQRGVTKFTGYVEPTIPVSNACITALAPTVTTNAVTFITQTGATLNGTINPNGTATNRRFEYGPTALYGTTSPDLAIGAGSAGVGVSLATTALACNTLYHYRAVGQNSAGIATGGDLTFTTAACPAPGSNNITALTARSVTLDSGSRDSMSSVRGEIWYRVRLFASRSYQIAAWPVDHEQGADAPALSLSLFSDNAGTTPATPAPLVSSLDLEGSSNRNGDALPSSMLFQPTATGVYKIRILRTSGGAVTQSVSVAVRETTLFSPWTSRAAGFEGFIEMHNNTNAALNVTLRAYDSTGTLQGAGLAFSVPANATVFHTASETGVPVNVFAGVVLTHDGAFGAMSGNITTLNGANGLSFDSPFTPRDGSQQGLPVR